MMLGRVILCLLIPRLLMLCLLMPGPASERPWSLISGSAG
jgi:hypothetical protein